MKHLLNIAAIVAALLLAVRMAKTLQSGEPIEFEPATGRRPRLGRPARVRPSVEEYSDLASIAQSELNTRLWRGDDISTVVVAVDNMLLAYGTMLRVDDFEQLMFSVHGICEFS